MILSGSKFHLATLCSYPFSGVQVPESEPGDAARLGSEVHAYLQDGIEGTLVTSMYSKEAAAIGERLLAWVRDAGGAPLSELAIVYDAEKDTARQVRPTTARDYGPIGPMEIPVTLDLLWVEEDHVIVRDAKSGRREYAHREQLVIQALAATRLLGKRWAKVGFLWGRKTKCEADPLEVLSEEQLEAESWRVASVLRGLPTSRPVTGKHCFFCELGPRKAPGACPAYQQPTEQELTEAYGT